MKNKGLNRLWVGFIAAILFVLVVSGVSYFTLMKQADNGVWVEHTYKVLNQVSAIKQLVVNMETGRRGFRCTNDRSFLAPYFKSQPKLVVNIENLKNLVSDNPAQAERVKLLERHVYSVDSLWRTININVGYTDSVQKIEVTRAEKTLMDAVNNDIDSLNDSEEALLRVRDKDSNSSISQAILSLVVGTVIILCIVSALIMLIISEFRRRVKAQETIKEKLIEAEQTNKTVQQSNWQLTGVREINGSLIGSGSLQATMDNCLAKVTGYMGLPAGAFYFYDKESGLLELVSAKALPGTVKKTIRLNEGIAGQAAASKEITVVNNVPADYWKIESATGGMAPDTVICAPLWAKGELVGLIELACMGCTTERDIILLKAVADNVAIAVNGAYVNERMYKLMQKLQEQTEELEAQQEELRHTNEMLTHQAETLKASEEELKTQEEELRQLNTEMEEKTESINAAHQALAQKAKELEVSNNYKSEFLANMSHELRTPLNSVLILANLLKENKQNNLAPKQIEYATIIHRSGTDLLNLINDILDLSKIEAGKIEINIEQIKISGIATDMEQTFGVLAAERKIRFAINTLGDVPEMVNTDKQRVEQVIKNLLSNAFKFTPESGSVTLSFARHINNLAISVTDTGIGIPREQQKLIFEAFQQADGTISRKFGGTGLGLSISKELVKKLGGAIHLESSPGIGSTFTIYLPLTNVPLTANTLPQHNGAAKMPGFLPGNVKEQTLIPDDKKEAKPGEPLILIIEDDIVFAKHVKDFANSKGYKAIIAISGDEGILYANRYKPAAIILDLGLPVINGRNVLKIIKSDKELKHIPIHVISAQDKTGIPPGHIESYLLKPLQSNDLEHAFTNIAAYIREHNKSILVVSERDEMIRGIFEKLPTSDDIGVLYDMVETAAEAKEILQAKNIDCVIVDIDKDIAQGITTIKDIRDNSVEKMYIITCLEGDISAGDEKLLKKYSNSIIRKSSYAPGRLLDEVELFLHKIKHTHEIAVPETYHKEYDKSLHGKKVLLADDDMRNVFALSALLEQEGMDVIAVENGKEAIDLLNNNTDVDIALMDIMMPEMDGYETIARIRADGRFNKLPILAITAKAMAGDREKCIAAGASDYITKPIDNNKLFSLMRVWLAQ